jgi:hypothetical protein
MDVDKQLIKAYQYRLLHMPSDAKHNTFISERRGGMGLRVLLGNMLEHY